MIKILKDTKKQKLIEDYIYAALGSLIYALAFNLLIMPLNLECSVDGNFIKRL